jgi:hypothetical protein
LEQPRILWSAVIAALIAAAGDAVYVAIIISEGEGELREALVLGITGLLAVTALALAVAAWPVRFRVSLLVASATALAVLTVLGAASIGVFFLPAAILAGIAAAQAARAR